jgi:ribosomal protein L39E
MGGYAAWIPLQPALTTVRVAQMPKLFPGMSRLSETTVQNIVVSVWVIMKCGAEIENPQPRRELKALV